MSIDKWMDKEAVVHIYNGILLSHKMECIWVSSNEVDEPTACYTEWRKSEREKQISFINAYMWNLERWYWWNCFQASNGDADTENTLMGKSRGRGRRGWDGEKHGHICTTVCKTDSQWEFCCMIQGTQTRLCSNLGGWERVEEVQEGGDRGRSQDSRGIKQGDHILPHKFIRSFECWATSTKQLL